MYIGIDPGVSGGVAALDRSGTVILACKMPVTAAEVVTLFRGLSGLASRQIAILEQVAAWAPSGRRMGATSAFTFGLGVGRLEAALAAAEIPYDRVAPRVWQQVLGCRTKGDKNISKARALQLWPRLTVTHAIADALLLAEYCRRTHLSAHRREVDQYGEATDEGHVQTQGGGETGTGAAQHNAAGHGAGARQGARRVLRGHR